jgi:hypothetical protein
MRDEDRPEPLPPTSGAPVERARVSNPGGTLYIRQPDERTALARLLAAG